jgi:integrase
MKGSVFKRCQCPVERNARGQRLACKKNHGSWFFVADAGVSPATGKRRQIKRGGFATKDEAESALAELVDSKRTGQLAHDERQSVAVFLAKWLADKERNGLRPTTLKSYRQHIDDYIVPVIGRMRLRDVKPGHVDEVLLFVRTQRRGRRAAGATSVRRVHATMRSAFGTAKRRRLIGYNPAADVELPEAARPKVQPWEPAELGRFLDLAAADEFGPLFETVAGSGARRGEALGLRWDDIDLERGRAIVRQQIVQLDGDEFPCAWCGGSHRGLLFGKPKTRSGEARNIDLDAGVVGVLMAHRLQQDAQRAQWGSAYSDHGLVFARADGNPISPERVTKRFRELVKAAGLRPVRLHDLRHGRASLLLASGTDIALVSKLLGHSSISITSDTYSHLLAGVGREAAERASALVPRARSGDPRDQSVTSRALEAFDDRGEDAGSPENSGPLCAPPGTRTPNPLIKSQLLCQLS